MMQSLVVSKPRNHTRSFNTRTLMFQINPCCWYCGLKLTIETSTLDHVVPRSKGGLNSNNTVLACKTCNAEKGSRRGLVDERVLDMHHKIRNLRRALDKQK